MSTPHTADTVRRSSQQIQVKKHQSTSSRYVTDRWFLGTVIKNTSTVSCKQQRCRLKTRKRDSNQPPRPLPALAIEQLHRHTAEFLISNKCHDIWMPLSHCFKVQRGTGRVTGNGICTDALRRLHVLAFHFKITKDTKGLCLYLLNIATSLRGLTLQKGWFHVFISLHLSFHF